MNMVCKKWRKNTLMLVLQYICMTPRNTWFRIAEQKNLRKKAEKSSLKNCSILAQNIYHVVYKKKWLNEKKLKVRRLSVLWLMQLQSLLTRRSLSPSRAFLWKMYVCTNKNESIRKRPRMEKSFKHNVLRHHLLVPSLEMLNLKICVFSNFQKISDARMRFMTLL